MQKSLDRVAKNVRLAININERKKIAVAFEGNSGISSSTLRDELTLLSRGAYDDFEVGSSADAIQRHYQADGYFFARVDWRRERLSADEERVVFMIDEGPQLRVRGIEFAGNKSLPAGELAEVVSVRKYPPLGLGAGGYVTGKQMEQDVERIVEHYRSRGFLEAKAHAEAATSPAALGQIGAVAAGADTVSREAKTIFVRYTIEEGPRLMLASEDFRTEEGEPLPYDKQFLLESVTTRPGDPYTPQAVRDDGRRLERLLGDAGYPGSSVDPDVNRSGDTVSLTWVLKLGPRVRIGPIFVRGNFKTTPETILEQIPLKSGGYLTTTAVERGQRNLGFLQLFNNATPISFPGQDENRAVVPMVVEVEERYEQYSVLHAGAGVSTEQKPPNSALPFGVYMRVGYENRNFWGHGWSTAANLTYGTALLRGDLTFLDRRFLGTLFRFDISAQLSAAGDGPPRRHPVGRRLDRLLARDVPGRRRRPALQPAQHHPHRTADSRRRPRRDHQQRPAGHHGRQPVRVRRVAAHGQPAGARRAAFASTPSRSWRCPRCRRRCARFRSTSATTRS